MRWEREAPLCYALALAMLAIVPWMLAPSACGDHCTHWRLAQEWLAAWQQGVWWPSYYDHLNGGCGSFWPSYYPPLYQAGIAARLALGLDYWLTAGLFLLLCHLGGTTGSYFWLRQHVGPRAAAWGAGAFALSPYAFLNFHHRGAFPEGLALEWLPGVLWACDRLRRKWEWSVALRGTICFALIILFNYPALVVAGYTVLLYGLTNSLLRGRLSWLLNSLALPLGGLALTAFFWLPVWLEQSWYIFPKAV